jgi:hypothetical protein
MAQRRSAPQSCASPASSCWPELDAPLSEREGLRPPPYARMAGKVPMTDDFLSFSKAAGTFHASKAGDWWRLCAARCRQAFEAGMAPRVILSATHERTLEIVALQDLKRFAIDLS